MVGVTQAGQPICRSDALSECGSGVRFDIRWNGAIRPAFVVRHHGKVYAYLNQCAHRQLELDWAPSQFFDASGDYLICAMHGARYLPGTGVCTGGPCRGGRLNSLTVDEADGLVFLRSKDALHLMTSQLGEETARHTS